MRIVTLLVLKCKPDESAFRAFIHQGFFGAVTNDRAFLMFCVVCNDDIRFTPLLGLGV